jgi:hypothetical protein
VGSENLAKGRQLAWHLYGGEKVVTVHKIDQCRYATPRA